jgi:hypothetical protein
MTDRRRSRGTPNRPQVTPKRRIKGCPFPRVLSLEIPSLLIFGLHLLVVDPRSRQVLVLQLRAGHGEASIFDTHLSVALCPPLGPPHRARPTPARRRKRRVMVGDFRSRGS